MPKSKFTLQDYYLEKANSKYATGQCESCYLDFKPEQIIWSDLIGNFSCKSCIKEAKELAQIKAKSIKESKTINNIN